MHGGRKDGKAKESVKKIVEMSCQYIVTGRNAQGVIAFEVLVLLKATKESSESSELGNSAKRL